MIPPYPLTMTAMIPKINRIFGCLYSPTMDFLKLAISTILSIIGSMRPFRVPTAISIEIGFEIKTTSAVAKTINNTMTIFSYLSMVFEKLLTKDTDAYAPPMIELIAANNMTAPNVLYPMSPPRN